VQRPEVVFYVLASSNQQERQDFACKLIEKIYRGDTFCYVLTEGEEQAEEVDKALWCFRAGSFVPHQRYLGVLPNNRKTILIGANDIPSDWQRVIVNLSTQFPAIVENTERIVEILDNSEASKRAGRERYRHYMNAGLEIITHKQEGGRWVAMERNLG
jgi:DNA polymerase-3 subunit chi